MPGNDDPKWPVIPDFSGKIVVLPDIHGNLGDFRRLLAHCGAADAKGRWLRPAFTLVLLGDLIDRHASSRECVELARNLERPARGAVIVLRGNHEDLMLRRLEKPDLLPLWIENGGRQTLASFSDDFDKLCSPGGEVFEWLNTRPYAWQAGKVLFVHGGLSQDNLDGSDFEKLLWARPPLAKGAFEAVVSGHTPTSSGKVEASDNVFRCDIGLGYRAGGTLEYLVLEMTNGKMGEWEVAVIPG